MLYLSRAEPSGFEPHSANPDGRSCQAHRPAYFFRSEPGAAEPSEPYAEAVLAAEAVQPRGCAVAVLPEIRGDYAGGVVPP